MNSQSRETSEHSEPRTERDEQDSYFCTIYYTPRESGFTAAQGFTPEDLTPTTFPGLQNRTYPYAFLKAVRTEGFGRIKTAFGGRNYIAYDGNWRYEETPLGNRGNPLEQKVSCAVRTGAFSSGDRLRLRSREVEEAFENLDWVVDDTGGGLGSNQIDLYWGEDDPHGRGEGIHRPAGTGFTRADSVIVSAGSRDAEAHEFVTAAPRRETVEKPAVDTSMRLDSNQYIQETHPKSLLVLHHTEGSTAEGTFDQWQNTTSRTATAYIVEKDGTIYEVFDPKYYAYHIGPGSSATPAEKRSVGIEIVCEGELVKEGGLYYCFPREEYKRRYHGPVFDYGAEWRDYRYWAAYTPEQIGAVNRLADYLCDTFSIPRQTPQNHLDENSEYYQFSGVLGHHQLVGKRDVHPGFPWSDLIAAAHLAEVDTDT
jgi:N-acetyl-anhydromuramyl-L-alanine amidase AmpD